MQTSSEFQNNSAVIKPASVQFRVNHFTGSGEYIFPLSITPARDLTPDLALCYRTGANDGVLGLGFELPIASISRSTVKGIPSYDDNKDQFILSGEDTLVEVEKEKKTLILNDIAWQISLFQPCTGTTIKAIEYWYTEGKKQNYWLVRDNNGVNHIFGKNNASKISHPKNNHTFTWLLEQSYDSKGNKIIYEYEYEQDEKSSNRYLTSIKYGNYFVNPQDSAKKESFAFVIDFNYKKRKVGSFTSYRSGFAIETRKLCEYITLSHQFNAESFSVKQWCISYETLPKTGINLLTAIQEKGFRKIANGTELSKLLPPVNFEYHLLQGDDPSPNKTLKFEQKLKFADSLTSPAGRFYQFIDLFREGLPGILYSDAVSSIYWRNKGKGQFSSPEFLTQFPLQRNLISFKNRLMDIPGNDQLAFVVAESTYGGYYESLEEGEWKNFQPFENYPLDFTHPNAEFIDLNNRGLSDLVIMDALQAYYYPALGKKGFDDAKPLKLPKDFPHNAILDPTQLVTFANILGDGLLHRVKITRDKVEYWPNLGNGEFGEKREIARAPVFDENFDASRLYLIDVKGTGAVDIIYVGEEQSVLKIYFNQKNRFSDTPLNINLPEPFTHFDRIYAADLLGNGSACLVFIKNGVNTQHYYYDFAPNHPLFLLKSVNNNCGASTEITYTSSAQIYLNDLENKRKPACKSSIAVRVVEKTITRDEISGLQLVQRYQFHDGYYDPFEREFCGFGFVEHWDSDEQKSHENDAPTQYSKHWYYNGYAVKEETSEQRILHPYRAEFYALDKSAKALPPSQLDKGSLDPKDTIELRRQAELALRGKLIRQEIYGEDNDKLVQHPYSVSENNFTVQCHQLPSSSQAGIFVLKELESISYEYERNADDPRIAHHFYIEWDEYNQLIKQAVVYYPRRQQKINPDELAYKKLCLQINDEQNSIKIVCFTQQLLNKQVTAVAEEAFNWLGYPLQTLSFVIEPAFTAIEQVNFAAIKDLFPNSDAGIQEAYLIKRKQYYYWDNECKAMVENQDVNSVKRLLLHHHETFVASQTYFEQCYADNLFKDKTAELTSTLQQRAGYLLKNSAWWKPGLITHYDEQAFYLPKAVTSQETAEDHPLWSKSTIAYDAYQLVPVKTQDYLYEKIQQHVQAVTRFEALEIDYYTLNPRKVKDANGVITEVLFDALGVAVAVSHYGEVNHQSQGNYPLKEDLLTKLADASLQAIVQNSAEFLAEAGQVIHYDLLHWKNSNNKDTNNDKKKLPNWTIIIQREQYQRSLKPFVDEAVVDRVPMMIQYHDGLGDTIQSKIKVEPGKALQLKESKEVVEEAVKERWLISPYIQFNSKGLPAAEYLPFYIGDLQFTNQAEFIKALPEPHYYSYDALNRITKLKTSLSPNYATSLTTQDAATESYQRTAWYTLHFDSNDNSDIQFYKDTPTVKLFDVLGNRFLQAEIYNTEKEPKLLKTKTHYNAIGQVIALQDPRLAQPNIYYKADKLNQILVQNSVDSGLKANVYNRYGNVLHSWNNRQFHFSIDYDNWQRPLAKWVEGPDIAKHAYERIEYGDLTADAGKQNLFGEIISYYDQAGILHFNSFDINGGCLHAERSLFKVNLAQLDKPVDWASPANVNLAADSFVNEARYNALAKQIQQKQIDGSVILRQDDLSARTKRIMLQLAGENKTKLIIDDVEYLANGQRSLLRYGNGIETQFNYDMKTQALIKWNSHHPGKQKTFQDVQFIYDPMGNITDIDDKSFQALFPEQASVIPNSKQEYAYDSLYRLRKATGIETAKPKELLSPQMSTAKILTGLLGQEKLKTYQESYEYDDGNNLIKRQHDEQSVNYAIDVNSNHLQQAQENTQQKTYHYDEAGNLKNLDQQTELRWNYLNQLVYLKKTQDSGIVEEFYNYNAGGQRVRKLTKHHHTAEIDEIIYFGQYEIVRSWQIVSATELKLISEKKALRLFDDQQCVATCYFNQETSTAGELIYSLPNHLRSVVVELDEQANLLTYEEYLPFGDSTFIIGEDHKAIAAKKYHYSGKEHDEQSGLYYYGARYYAANLGRWSAADPMEFIDGLNLYAFVKNNPINLIDLLGFSGNGKQMAVDQQGSMGIEEVPDSGYLAEDDAKDNGQTPVRNRLFLGGGNLSYELSYALKHPSVRKKMVATTYDTEDEMIEKYGFEANRNKRLLQELKVMVVHGVDATKLSDLSLIEDKKLKPKTIHFSHPHLQSRKKGVSNAKNLVYPFFESAANVQEVSDKIIFPCSKVLKHYGFKGKNDNGGMVYQVKAKYKFNQKRYPLYEHKQTKNNRSAKSVEKESIEFIFEKTHEKDQSNFERASVSGSDTPSGSDTSTSRKPISPRTKTIQQLLKLRKEMFDRMSLSEQEEYRKQMGKKTI